MSSIQQKRVCGVRRKNDTLQLEQKGLPTVVFSGEGSMPKKTLASMNILLPIMTMIGKILQ